MSYNSGIVENHSYNLGLNPSPSHEERLQEIRIRPTNPFDDPPPTLGSISTKKNTFVSSGSSIWRTPARPTYQIAKSLASLRMKTMKETRTSVASHVPHHTLIPHPDWTAEEKQALLRAVAQETQRGQMKQRAYKVFRFTHPDRTLGAIKNQYARLMKQLDTISSPIPREDNPEAIGQITKSVQNRPLPPGASSEETYAEALEIVKKQNCLKQL